MLGKREGITEFSEIMDIAALKEIIPVLTNDEFIRESAEHLSIPHKFRDEQYFYNSTENKKNCEEWKQWLFVNTMVANKWNPYDTLICYPDRMSIDLEEVPDSYRDGRELIELTPSMNAAPVIHFPSDSENRSLGPVATMLAPSENQLPKLTRRFIKNHIRYHPRIFELASELISVLGCNKYTALHIRRNDFQYKQTRAQAETTWNNISSLVTQSDTTYIATDEVEEDFRNFFRSKKTILFWDDLIQNYFGEKIPEKYIGPIEQLICVGASRFIGTDLSTFSSYIVRMRGYREAPDTASYYHTEKYNAPIEEPNPAEFRGRNYLQENPLFWREC